MTVDFASGIVKEQGQALQLASSSDFVVLSGHLGVLLDGDARLLAAQGSPLILRFATSELYTASVF